MCSCHSFAWLLPHGAAVLAAFLERGAEAVEAGFPQSPVAREPRVELAERLRPKRVDAALPVRSHRYETRLVENAQVPRDTGLVDPGLVDDLANLSLAAAQ